MADLPRLAAAFLAGHSGEAARVMEVLPAEESAAFLHEAPARLGAPVVAAMLPAAAARVIARMPEESALGLLTAAGPQAAVAILRHVPEPRRTGLIAALPTLTAVASRILLGFPEDAVGAWTDPEVVALAPTDTAGAAIARIRASDTDAVTALYLVDAERRLLGCVGLPALLRVAETTTLAVLARPVPAAVAAMMPLGAAAGLPAWSGALALPVIDRDGRLVGTLRHALLLRALSDRARQKRAASDASLVGVLGTGYWGIVSGLATAALALLPRVAPVLPPGAERAAQPPGAPRPDSPAAAPPGAGAK